MKRILSILLLLLLPWGVKAETTIYPGAARLDMYLPLLQGKSVGLFANHSSRVGNDHLIDVLLKNHVHIAKIFAPEHGFRGEEDHQIQNTVDSKTGIPIISLYGKKLRPSQQDLQDIDILVFDIQDVGVRFYTYISSLQKFMEAAAENHKTLILLDRPNPNGFYVDGPVLDPKYKSFTGMQPVPIVYGMTMGEYAKMLVGESWLKPTAQTLNLVVIPCYHYSHRDHYTPPVQPSPNLQTIQAIYWYPSIGLMEATAMSVGRGTSTPFQVFGHPLLQQEYSFLPNQKVAGAWPRYCGKVCHGWNLTGSKEAVLKAIDGKLQIKYLIQAYHEFPHKEHFFQGFSYSAGNNILEKQIKLGLNEEEIRKSWTKALQEFKKIRKKYLLYPDFE